VFESIIKFKAKDIILENKDLYPAPTKLNIPEWYKNLDHKIGDITIKGCMPFLDTLTSGYTLKMPIDYYLAHNTIVDGNRVAGYFTAQTNVSAETAFKANINTKDIPNYHPTRQLGEECPFNKKNKNLPFHKILNPWTIITPPGYSCLFLPPLNNSDDRFSIIPGIVDTDVFENPVNFPIIINGDKYPVLESTVKAGTPYVQVFPFKRDNWKMKIETTDDSSFEKKRFKLSTKIIHNYKQIWWNKKSWK